MIFKTFNNDIDKISAKWGIFGKSFNDIGTAISGKISDINKNFQATDDLIGSIKNSGDSIWARLYPTKEQIASLEVNVPELIDTTKANEYLNVMKQIDAGIHPVFKSYQDWHDELADGEKWIAKHAQSTKGQIRSLNGVTEANQQARATAIAHNEGLKQQTLGAKAATVAMKTLSVAGNMLAGMLLSWGVSKLIEGIDNLVHAQEKLKKSAEEAISTFKNSKETLQANKKTIDSIYSGYERLSKGVDEFGNNISLSAEEYSKYNDIVNQIADMFPQMVQGYTDEGNAILTLKGNVEELTKAYEASASAARQSFIATGNDIIKNIRNTDTVSDYQEIIDKLYLNDEQAIRELAQYFNDNIDKYGQKNEVVLELEKIFKEQGIEVRFNNLRADTFFTDEDVEYYLQDEIQSKLQSAIKSLTIELEGNESIAKSQGYSLLEAMLGENYTFATLPKEIQDYVKTISREFDHEFYAQFENKDDMFSYVLNNLVLPTKDKDFTDALTVAFNLKTQFNNNEIPVSKYQEKMSAFLETISTLPEDAQEAIKLIFGIETDENGTISSSVDTLVNNVKEKLQGTSFDDNVGELNLGDLQIAAEQVNVPLDSIESWEELLALIQKVKDKAVSNEPDLFSNLLSSKETIDDFISSVESASDAYATLMNPNVSSSDMLSSIFSITQAVSEMGGKLNFEFIDANDNSLKLLGDTIDYITKKYIKSQLISAGFGEDFAEAMANSIVESQKAARQLEDVNTQIDSLQAAYDNLTDIVKSYNSTGRISFDQLQTLLELEPQYLSCLVDENGQLQLNKQAMLSLAEQRLQDARIQAVQQAISELRKIELSEEKTAVEDNAEAFSDAVYDMSLYNKELSNTIAKAGLGAQYIGDLNTAITGAESKGATDDQITTVLDNLVTKLKLIDTTAAGGLSSLSDNTSDYIDAYMEYMEASLNAGKITFKEYSTDVTAFLKKMFDDGKLAAADYYNYTKQMLEVQKDVMDKVADAVVYRIDKEIETLEKDKTAIEETYQLKIDAIQAEIDALEESNQKRQDQIDLELAEYNLRRALTQRTQKLYTGEKGYIYRADGESVRESQDDLYNKKYELNISRLESQIESLEKEMESATSSIDDQIETLEEYKEQWNSVADEHNRIQAQIYADQVLGQEWEETILDKREEKVKSFRDTYVGIMKEIEEAANKAAEANLKVTSNPIKISGGERNPQNNGDNAGIENQESNGEYPIDKTPSIDNIYIKPTIKTIERIADDLEEYADDLVQNGISHGVGKNMTLQKFSNGGVVSAASSSPLAQAIGEDIIIATKDGERILTPVQNAMWEKWTNALPNLQNLSNMLQVKTPDYSSLNNLIMKQQPITLNIGDIHLHNVQNVEDFGQQIVKRLPNAMLQAVHRR